MHRPLRRPLDINTFVPDLEQEIAELTDEMKEEFKDSVMNMKPGGMVHIKNPADLLDTRQSTHGEFGDNARVSQSIKRILRAEPGWDLLTDTEREAMDMIALKFSRILSGKSLELQHWEDVVGYARLAEKLCKGA